MFLAGSSASRLMSPLNFFFSFLGFAEQQSLLELSRLAGLNIRGDIFLIVSLRCHKHVVNGARASVSPLVLCSIKSNSVGKVMY